MTDKEILKNLNDFFWNTIKTLGFSKFDPNDSVCDNVNGLTLTLYFAIS